jgi:hypothetical protein
VGVATLISDKADFMQKSVRRDKEIKKVTYTNKGNNSSRRYNTSKYICIEHPEHQCPQVHKTNTSQHKGTTVPVQ